jgi:predicted ribosome quality control (RQC) complex YloA/Tae2 family protein
LSSFIALVAQRLLGRFLKVRVDESHKKKQDEETPEEYSEAAESIDDELYQYIQSNGGAISVRAASEDLGLPPEAIKEALRRMTIEGRLKA